VARNRITARGLKKKGSMLEDLGYTGEDGLVFPEFMLTESDTPEVETQRMLFREMLFEALTELPENQRTVFKRNELGAMNLQQIVDEDGVPLKTTISRNRYAVLHLRRRLEEF